MIFRLLKIYKKIHKFMDVLNYFTTKEWDFSNDRVNALIEKMTPQDREIFPCDMKTIIWDKFFQTYIKGIRIYLIKDPMETLPAAIVRWRRYRKNLTYFIQLYNLNRLQFKKLEFESVIKFRRFQL